MPDFTVRYDNFMVFLAIFLLYMYLIIMKQAFYWVVSVESLELNQSSSSYFGNVQNYL